MTTQGMDILARKIVSLEKRHNSLARTQQLPSSSVRLATGDDVAVTDTVEATQDVVDEAANLGDQLYDVGENTDSEAEYTTAIPEWIIGAGEVGNTAWDGTQFAVDLSRELETELGEAKLELDQALLDSAEALAEANTARQEAALAVQEAENAITAAGVATDLSEAAQTAATNAQTTAGNAQTAADQAAADALAATNTASDAQDAANAAQTTADAKGKVIIQGAAPGVADRLPQNLWIDTTSGGNTPKRWDGSNWVAVTDKAATDAAAAAATAQTRADNAFNAAADAATAAGNAQTAANGKNRVWYQDGQPAGTGHQTGDTWFDTNDGNRIYRWNGSWVAAQFGTNAISDTAINAAKLASNAVTEGKILNGAISSDKLNTAVKNSITTAQSTADNAASVAANATTAASAAQGAATAAQGDADQAIADALAASNAASAADGKAVAAQSTAANAATAASTADGKATTAQTTASNAASAASTADGKAVAAATAASNAATAASTADGKAVTAQNIANAKGKVIIQSAAPAAADRLVQNLWIDTTGGANTPKRWVSGTTWSVVTDKAATDAAAAAVTAKNAADAAQSRADAAHTVATGAQSAASAAASAASSAQTAANNAQTTANGKNKIVRSTADASTPANYVAGDQWWKFSGGQITGMWIHSGSAWVVQTLTDSVITNLNAGTITAGTISAARLSATNIKSVLVSTGALEAANIMTGAITAASGIIADAAIGTAKIIDGSITTAKIENLAVTNAEIANGTIQNAKIANLDAAKITTGFLAAARIQAGTIVADKLATNAVTAEKIAAGAVTAEKIMAESVTAEHLMAEAVTAEKIMAGAISADKILANAITGDKMAVNALDAMTIRGAQIYGGYIEAPTIASSDRLGSGANKLNDPTFSSTVNTAWVASGHLGDSAVTQRDTVTWDQTWTMPQILGPLETFRNWGNAQADLSLTPGVRRSGSLVFANYSWFNAAARSFSNPFTFKNQSTINFMHGQYGGRVDPSLKTPARAPGAGTAKTTFLTNSAVVAVVAGQRWNVRLGFSSLSPSEIALVSAASVQIINASTSAVLAEIAISDAGMQAGQINEWWDSTFTGNVKYRIRATYVAGGGGSKTSPEGTKAKMMRRPTAASTASMTGTASSPASWVGNPATETWRYESQPATTSVSDESWSPWGAYSDAYKHRAYFAWTIESAVFAEVEPAAGWRITEDEGIELFDSFGAQTGKIDGENNFLAGTFSTHESGRRLTLADEELRWFTSADVNRTSIIEDETGLNILSSNGIHSNRNLKVLWSGAWYMQEGQQAVLSEPISDQLSGIVLAWSQYSDGAGQNYGWGYHFIPKSHVVDVSGTGIYMTLHSSFSVMLKKYVYVNPTTIAGNINNRNAPHNSHVLRYVYGV